MVEPKKNQETIDVSWKEFDIGVKHLLKKINKEYKNVYGLPRGGLALAVMISHNLNIPLIINKKEVTKETLIVDDISDRGKTLIDFLKGETFDVATLYERHTSKYTPKYVYQKIDHDNWLIFPWEKKL